MTTHTITITLSPAAQRAAILAGEPAAQTQTYEVGHDLVARLLALPWARVAADGTVKCDVPKEATYYESTLVKPIGTLIVWQMCAGCDQINLPIDARPSGAAEAIAAAEGVVLRAQAELDVAREKHAREAEPHEAERTAREAAHLARVATDEARIRADVAGYVRGLPDHGAGADLVAPLHGLAVESPDLRAAVRTAVEAEQRRRGIAQSRRLAALLVELDLADERCRAPHATADRPLGLWSEAEALTAIQSRILPVGAGPGESASFGGHDVLHGEDCNDPDCEPSFIAPTASALTAEEYHAARAAIEALRAALPLVPAGNPLHTDEVWGCVYRHTGSRECAIETIERLEVTVTVALGDGVVVEREYAVVA